MFSKFDVSIQSDEIAAYEPTAQDWAEYSEWCDEQDAQLAAQAEFDALEDELITSGYDTLEDDYSDCDDEYYADYDLMGDLYFYD